MPFYFMFYFIRLARIRKMNETLIKLVNDRTEEISKKNELLIEQADELISINTNLQERGQQVEEQAEELKIQHDKLSMANATKDKLFSILAHDLRSPFNTLLGFSDLLLRNIREYTVEKSEFQVQLINESARSTFYLLENLLQWSRSQGGMMDFYPTEIDLLSILATELSVLDKQAFRKGIRLEMIVVGEKRLICADENMIASVIRNLISNAIKYSYKESVITVVVEFEEKQLIFSVKDNGDGVSQEVQSKLFKVNELNSKRGTSGEKGTGLGLLLCSDFIAKHKGNIWVESNLEKGSVFLFSLPYKSENC